MQCGCPDCRIAKRFLAQRDLAYREIDIETTPGGAEEVIRQTGRRAILQFVMDDERVQPYRLGEGLPVRGNGPAAGCQVPVEMPTTVVFPTNLLNINSLSSTSPSVPWENPPQPA